MHNARDVLAAALPILHAHLDRLDAAALHHLHRPLLVQRKPSLCRCTQQVRQPKAKVSGDGAPGFRPFRPDKLPVRILRGVQHEHQAQQSEATA